RQDNDARRVVWDYEEIKRQWKSLKNLETHFISEPPVISETKKAWGVLVDDLRAVALRLEKRLSSCEGKQS
ncbi:MAG: hypothetical protein HQM08_30380, partial [Candidatus Riflebacteria bacterium]|nr:hypothetical protein [Candidatus Riflebacteria bacterium]